jgi:hypothetical protein
MFYGQWVHLHPRAKADFRKPMAFRCHQSVNMGCKIAIWDKKSYKKCRMQSYFIQTFGHVTHTRSYKKCRMQSYFIQTFGHVTHTRSSGWVHVQNKASGSRFSHESRALRLLIMHMWSGARESLV